MARRSVVAAETEELLPRAHARSIFCEDFAEFLMIYASNFTQSK